MPRNRLTITLEGPQGCGKTTMANALAAIYATAGRKVKVFNQKTHQPDPTAYDVDVLIIDVEAR